MNKDSKIFIAGDRGMVGSAFVRKLAQKGYTNLISKPRQELDLTCQQSVETFFQDAQPEFVFLAAAKVGGIKANNENRVDFLLENLLIQNHVIEAAFRHQVRKLLFLGSSCVYPRSCPQPIKESHLLTGTLEQTNEPYAIAKIAGIKLCESYNRQYQTNFIPLMPCNLYGPGDNYNLDTSHVLPALIKKFLIGRLLADKQLCKAMQLAGLNEENAFQEFLHNHQISEKKIGVWGSGKPRREFLHVDDLAECGVFIMERLKVVDYQQDERTHHLNIGFGSDIEIRELVDIIKGITGFKGEVEFDLNLPDGTPQKLLDSGVINSLGWKPRISLAEGIRDTFQGDFNNYIQSF